MFSVLIGDEFPAEVVMVDELWSGALSPHVKAVTVVNVSV